MIVKRVVLVMFLILTLAMFMGSVSAASNSSLTWAEVENSSYAVQKFTESKGDIPSSVSVSGKNVTDNAYLEVLCKAVVKANSNNRTSVSVVGRGNPPAPSGSASGTLTKSQYLTVANNIKSFYTNNNRAPNYAESSIGNIRYETLVYMYSKIMNYYRINDALPSSITFSYVSGISSSRAYVDVTAPKVNSNIPWGTYNTPKTVTLTASDNADANPKIYYRLNYGTWMSATKTVSLTMGEGRTYLDYYGRDDSGNVAPTNSGYFTIDMEGPSVAASPTSSCDNASKLVSLIANDNFDTNPAIYYTLNGSDPLSSSLRYSSPLNITNTTTLNFFAIDNVGNTGPVSSETYTIGNPVVNRNTGNSYSRIQDAIDDVLTLNGDVIQLYSATFLENVVINKNITLIAASNTVVNALNSSLPVFTVNSNGSGSTISGLNLGGGL